MSLVLGRLTSFVVTAAVHVMLVLGTVDAVFAQGGSTGGSLGKADQELSGELRKPAESPTRSQVVHAIEFVVTSVAVVPNGIRVTLRMTKQGDHKGVLVAFFAHGSDGIADFWKFSPRSDALLLDELGHSYELTSEGFGLSAGSSGLGFARDENDWTRVVGSEPVTVILTFVKDRSARVGFRFNLSFTARFVVYSPRGNNPNLYRAAVSIHDIQRPE